MEVEHELERNEEEAMTGEAEMMEEALRMSAEELFTPPPPSSQQPTQVNFICCVIVHVLCNCILLTFLSNCFILGSSKLSFRPYKCSCRGGG